MLVIKKIETWETSDGAKHHTHEMAEQYVLNEELLDDMVEQLGITRDAAQDILNFFGGRRPAIRCWLDSIDKMEKASMS